MHSGHLRSIKGTSPPFLQFHFHHSLSLSLSLSLSTLSQIPNTTNLVQIGVLLLKRTAFQPYSNIMKGKFDYVHMHG